MSDAPKRSHKKKVPDARQQGVATNLGKAFPPLKRSHEKKGTAAYARQMKKAALFGALYGQKSFETPPKRSHKKKDPALLANLPALEKANPDFPQTATTFWRQMEPGIHKVMQAVLSKAITSKRPSKEESRRVTRRIYRAAILSAATFFQKASPAEPSEDFLREQGMQAVNKAVLKAADSLADFDSGE